MRENVMFECDGKPRWWENKKKRGIAGIWQCLVATFLLETPVPRWLVSRVWYTRDEMANISPPWNTRAEMTNVPSPWYPCAEMVEWEALKYVEKDSLYRRTKMSSAGVTEKMKSTTDLIWVSAHDRSRSDYLFSRFLRPKAYSQLSSCWPNLT